MEITQLLTPENMDAMRSQSRADGYAAGYGDGWEQALRWLAGVGAATCMNKQPSRGVRVSEPGIKSLRVGAQA